MSHAPSAPAHPPASSTPSGGGIHPPPSWLPSAIVAFCVILFIGVIAKGCASKPSSQASVVAYTAPREERNVIRYTTPAEISTNFRYSLEADGPIKVTYEDGQWYIYKPGGGCFVAPTPRSLGPKKFTDPNNEGGHVNFRIYRLRPDEKVCNQ